MKTLIIYNSVHKKNTEKIATAMAEAMNAKAAKVDEVKTEDLTQYDLIGFGSGIYAGKLNKRLVNFIEKMPPMNKNVFVFCTAGSGNFEDKTIREKLLAKGCKIVGEFSCPGEFSPLGFNIDKKGHPDAKDMENARVFGNSLMNLQLKGTGA